MFRMHPQGKSPFLSGGSNAHLKVVLANASLFFSLPECCHQFFFPLSAAQLVKMALGGSPVVLKTRRSIGSISRSPGQDTWPPNPRWQYLNSQPSSCLLAEEGTVGFHPAGMQVRLIHGKCNFQFPLTLSPWLSTFSVYLWQYPVHNQTGGSWNW